MQIITRRTATMSELFNHYAIFYRWEMFRHKQAAVDFRKHKRHSAGGFADLVRRRRLVDEPVLDCSCGLGFKTIVLREAGLSVEGADGCADAVKYARQVARSEGHGDLVLFQATWAELARRSSRRYAAIFNDALSWVDSDEEMNAALHGIHDTLRPGGLLVYMGALPGSGTSEHRNVLREEWERVNREGWHRLGFQVSDGDTTVIELLTHERGKEYIDEHHLYLIKQEQANKLRLENATIRHSRRWSWPRMSKQLRGAGFKKFNTHAFAAANGRVFQLVVAERG